MVKDSPKFGTGTVTLKNDPRILPFGRFLRKSKINELPQLLNILIGDMSVIGPRPQTKRCFDAFPLTSQKKIMQVKPGLSGLGSIAFRDEENIMSFSNDPIELYDNVIMPYKGALEEWYVENRNILTYFYLLVVTIFVIIRPNSKVLNQIFPNLPPPPLELSIKADTRGDL